MKRCPECGREYDNTMMFCLDDGAELLYGPASLDESTTSTVNSAGIPSEAPTRPQIHTTNETAVLPARTKDNVPRPRGLDKRLLAAPFLLAIIALGGFFGYRYFRPAETEQISSIAVMPFVNDSGNPEIEYLSDGMTETLIRSLSQLPHLNVKARSSVFRYKGKETDAKKIGKDLNVQAILNGRVMQRGDQLTLNLELINVENENVIWADQYDRKSSDLVSLQNEIARDVSSKLQLKLSGTDQQKLAKNYTADPEAYQLYLKGNYQLNKRTEDSLKKGVEFFNQSIERDPSYALAYAGLADAYNQMGMWATLAPAESFSKAKAAAVRSLELDNTLGEAHTALAFEKFQHEWDFAGAESEYLQAITLNRNYSTTHELHGYQMYLAKPHEFKAAMEELKIAQDLDPLSLPVAFNIAALFYFERRYDETIEQLKKMHDLDPNFTLGNGLLGAAYMRKGMTAEAVAAWSAASTLEGQGLSPKSTDALTAAFRKSGIKAFLRTHVELLETESKQRYVSAYFVAIDYAYLEEKDLEFEWLEKAYQERSSWLTELGVDPVWADLHSDPRYADLIRRVGLPE